MKSRILWSAVVAASLVAAPAISFAQKDNQADIAQAVQVRMKAGLDRRNMEKSAFENDPKVMAAKEKVDLAEKEWSALQAQVDEAMKGDPDYQKAEEALKAADEKLATARKSLGDAAKAQAAANLQQEKSRASAPSGGSSGGQRSTYTPSTPKVNPLAGQIKAMKDAKDEDDKARLAMVQIKTKTQRALETKDDWKAAKASLDKAKADYEAAKRPVLEALKKKPEYLALERQEVEAQAKIDASR